MTLRIAVEVLSSLEHCGGGKGIGIHKYIESREGKRGEFYVSYGYSVIIPITLTPSHFDTISNKDFYFTFSQSDFNKHPPYPQPCVFSSRNTTIGGGAGRLYN